MSSPSPEPLFLDPLDPDAATVELQEGIQPPSRPRRERRRRRTLRGRFVSAAAQFAGYAKRPDLPARERKFRFGLAAVLLVVFLVLVSTGGSDTSTEAREAPAAAEAIAEEPTPLAAVAPAAEPEVKVPAGLVLRMGDQGEPVLLLQESLRALGLDPGEPDGIFGRSTRTAVVNFQIAYGLEADGVVGERTAQELNEALAGS